MENEILLKVGQKVSCKDGWVGYVKNKGNNPIFQFLVEFTNGHHRTYTKDGKCFTDGPSEADVCEVLELERTYRVLTTITDVNDDYRRSELFFESLKSVNSYIYSSSNELGCDLLFNNLDKQLCHPGDYVEIKKSLIYLNKNLGSITILITQLEEMEE